MRDLTRLPKVDLHVHLQGSMRPETTRELAARYNLEPPPGLRARGYEFADFDDFILNYIVACRCLQAPEDFRRLAHEFCEDESRQGVRYAEVTFTVAGQAIDGDWDAPVIAVLEGLAEGERDFGTRVGLVLDAPRSLPLEYAQQTLDVALRHAAEGVIAFGLGGPEARFPPEPFADLFRAATDGGLHSVPHAGEGAGPASIRGALDALGAERLGHGFRVLEDPDLTDEVRERGIPLEVCPTSNVATGLIASLDEHPLPRLMEEGLVVTLNSDDPAMFDSPLAGEYEAARRVFGFDDGRLADLARAGVRASFADQALKDEMESDIDMWMEEDP